MRRAFFLSTVLFSLLLIPRSQGEVAPGTPAPGSPERTAILDALCRPVQSSLKKPVVFKVDHFKTQNNWAFLAGVPLQPGNKPMDYRGTSYQSAIDEGVFDDWFCALLQKKKDGSWKVVDWQIGATDVAWDPWPKTYAAPASIFPK